MISQSKTSIELGVWELEGKSSWGFQKPLKVGIAQFGLVMLSCGRRGYVQIKVEVIK